MTLHSKVIMLLINANHNKPISTFFYVFWYKENLKMTNLTKFSTRYQNNINTSKIINDWNKSSSQKLEKSTHQCKTSIFLRFI